MSIENLEKESPSEKKDWSQYEDELIKCEENQEWSQLEELLLEEHPVLLAEEWIFEKLKDNLGRELRVKLDKSGKHVIPLEAEEKDN